MRKSCRVLDPRGIHSLIFDEQKKKVLIERISSDGWKYEGKVAKDKKPNTKGALGH